MTWAPSSNCSSPLRNLSMHQVLAGELGAAARLIDEDRLIAEATGHSPVTYAALMLAAWQGREREASELIQATVQEATGRGTGRLAGMAGWASAVLDNSLGRYDAARDAARRVFERDHLSLGHLIMPELAEGAARTGELTLVQAALDWLSERTRVTPTEWVLGIEAGVREERSAAGGPGGQRGPAHRAGLGSAARRAGAGPGTGRWCVASSRLPWWHSLTVSRGSG